jgi:hypothetical protein
MSKKGRADKRNREIESGNWRPGKWTPDKRGRFVSHAYRQCEKEIDEILGPHEGRVVAARLRSERNEVKSVAELRARGVSLLGDKNAEG